MVSFAKIILTWSLHKFYLRDVANLASALVILVQICKKRGKLRALIKED
jgi:hypothetical protein